MERQLFFRLTKGYLELCLLEYVRQERERDSAGLYKVEYSPPGGGGEIKSKGVEMWKKIKS